MIATTERGARRRDAAIDAVAAEKCRQKAWHADLLRAQSILPADANLRELEIMAKALRHPVRVKGALIKKIRQRRRQQPQPFVVETIRSTVAAHVPANKEAQVPELTGASIQEVFDADTSSLPTRSR